MPEVSDSQGTCLRFLVSALNRVNPQALAWCFLDFQMFQSLSSLSS